MENRGKVLAESPKCPLKYKVGASIIFILLLGCFLIPTGIFLMNDITIGIIFLLVTGFIFIVAMLMMRAFLYPHFTMYENGLSHPVYHTDPITSCKKVKPRIWKIKQPFILWSDIIDYKLTQAKHVDQLILTLKVKTLTPSAENSFYISMEYPTDTDELKDLYKKIIQNIIKHEDQNNPIPCPHCKELPRFKNLICNKCDNERIKYAILGE